MFDLVSNVLDRVSNFVAVLSSELSPIVPYQRLLGGLLWLVVFYFISKWFKSYILRVILFIMGITLFYDVMGRSHITTSVDFYISIGLFVPHISMVELTYLIIKERTLFLVDRSIEIFLIILSPFIWIYEKISNLFQFLQIKQEEKKQQRAKEDYYKEEFKKEQEKAYREEQQKYDYQDRKRQDEEQERLENKKEQAKKEDKTYSRWDSSNAYEVLGVTQNSTKQEIKKAYRNLAKIYHPDLAFTQSKEIEYTAILQKINWAYGVLK